MKQPITNTSRSTITVALSLSVALAAQVATAQVLLNVVETGGDNEPTDTILAKWSGQTWNATVNNEPIPGITIGTPYTAGVFGSGAPAYVDRNHRYWDDPGTGTFSALAVPAYLVGHEYIMSGNDNRDNAGYRLDLTLSGSARVLMLIDNRLSDVDALNPPTFGPTSMQWILDDGWLPTANGLNRWADTSRPDEVPIDEGADGSINQYFSVYYKDATGGSISLFQADNAGRNMYGVVVVPEPSTWALLGLGGLALFWGSRGRRS